MVEKKKATKKTVKTPVEKMLLKSFRRHARACGFKLQPDKKILDAIIKGELDRLKKYGALYCPCRRVTNNPEKDKKIICPCAYHKDEVKNDGVCKCRLYLKK